MTLQQREPFEKLAKAANPVHQKPANTLSKMRDKERAEKAKIINDIVKKSFLSNSKFNGKIHKH